MRCGNDPQARWGRGGDGEQGGRSVSEHRDLKTGGELWSIRSSEHGERSGVLSSELLACMPQGHNWLIPTSEIQCRGWLFAERKIGRQPQIHSSYPITCLSRHQTGSYNGPPSFFFVFHWHFRGKIAYRLSHSPNMPPAAVPATTPNPRTLRG